MPISDELWKKLHLHLTESLMQIRKASEKRSLRLTSALVILPLFAGALSFAWKSAGISLGSIGLKPLIILIALVPLSLFASTWQLRTATKAAGVGVSWWSTFRVIAWGTLSGLLPVSSGTVVRAGATLYWGAAPNRTAQVHAFDALIWLCISLLYSGGAAFLTGANQLALFMEAGGIILIPIAAILGVGLRIGDRLEILAARSLGVLLQVFRLQMCFAALASTITFAEASALAAAIPLASIFFFLPSGFGVREGFISAIGAVLGVGAAVAFLSAALNRLVGLSVILLGELVLLVVSHRRGDKSRP